MRLPQKTLLISMAGCVALVAALMGAVNPARAANRQLTDSSLVGQVTHFLPSPDNARVVFQTAGHLYSVPLSGGSATVLADSIGLTTNGPREFTISPDGTHVAYRGVPAGSGQPLGLWVAPIQGGAAQLLTTSIPPDTYHLRFNFSPDSSRVLFSASTDSATPYALYSVPIDGSRAPALLSVAPEAGSFGVLGIGEVVPGSGRVIYELVVPPQAGELNTKVNLYSVPIDGPASSSIHLNPSGPSYKTPWAYRISPDHSRIVFTQGASLFSSDLVGQNRVRLDKDYPPSELAGIANSFRISPQGDRVAYRVWHSVNGQGRIDAFTVPVAGPASASVQINTLPMSPTPNQAWPVFTSSGARVTLYTTGGLYSVPAAGPASEAILLGHVSSFWFPAPGGDQILLSTMSVGSLHDISAVSAAQPGLPQWAVAEMANVDVWGKYAVLERPMNVRFTPDGTRLIYQPANNHLYSVPVTGPISNTHDETQGPLAPQVEDNWQITADSTTLIYNVSGSLYATTLGSGPLVSHLLPGCQSTPATGTAVPTPNGADDVLYLPMIGRCYGLY